MPLTSIGGSAFRIWSFTRGSTAVGYAWAKRGWLPIDVREWAKVKQQMARRWARARRRNVPIEDSLAIERALQSDDVRHIHEISKTRWIVAPTPQKGRDVTLGNYLLGGTRWTGVLDLNNQSQMEVF